MRWSKLERLLFVFGVVMLAIYVGARIQGTVFSHAAMERFQSDHRGPADSSREAATATGKPDFSLWSEKRIKEYEGSLAARLAPPVGILRIPKIHVEVPILEGTDDLTLNRGVGRIEGTARPGDDGNIGIAGHRDGFFRGLKDVGPGDAIETVTPTRTNTYVVDRVVIVDPSDVSVLAPRGRPAVTLVTCYPFYFVGSAPKRYIVEASMADPGAASSHANERSVASSGSTKQ
jgi:sortase A